MTSQRSNQDPSILDESMEILTMFNLEIMICKFVIHQSQLQILHCMMAELNHEERTNSSLPKNPGTSIKAMGSHHIC